MKRTIKGIYGQIDGANTREKLDQIDEILMHIPWLTADILKESEKRGWDEDGCWDNAIKNAPELSRLYIPRPSDGGRKMRTVMLQPDHLAHGVYREIHQREIDFHSYVGIVALNQFGHCTDGRSEFPLALWVADDAQIIACLEYAISMTVTEMDQHEARDRKDFWSVEEKAIEQARWNRQEKTIERQIAYLEKQQQKLSKKIAQEHKYRRQLATEGV